MVNNKLISVIMGIYNCGDTLEKAVECIIEQTYSNWELIMCDDGSTDNTYDVAIALSKKDNRIKVIKNEKNMTLAPTLNRCFELAKGEYIARMDGDDVCDKNRFQKEYDFLEEHPQYVLVSSKMDLFDNDGVYRVLNYREKPSKYNLIKGSQFCHAGCMIRSNVLRELNGYSCDSKHNRVEDYDLWIRLYDKGYLGYNIQEVLYSMRDDRNAYCRRTVKNRINEANAQFGACKSFNAPIKYYLYPLMTLAKLLVPARLYKYLHKTNLIK